MTADEAIQKKDWKTLAKLQAEAQKQRQGEERKKKDEEFLQYATARMKKKRNFIKK